MKTTINMKNGSQIIILRGSVTGQKVCAIVNAANSTLLGGSGVDGEIHREAGPKLLEECRSLGGCPVGMAKVTGAYDLTNAKYIIHAVGPVYHGAKEDEDLLRSAYQSALDKALEKDCRSVAFPCISAGVFGYPLPEASRIAILACYDWLEEHPDRGMEIRLCCYRDNEFDTWLAVVEQLLKSQKMTDSMLEES